MFVVLNTFDKTNPDYPAGICYEGRTPALLDSQEAAKQFVQVLTEYNPGCVYKAYQLVEIGKTCPMTDAANGKGAHQFN